MGTVKYSGPVASFRCPTEAEIRSLKVHFSPKQLGGGTPSPENIRPIEGWDGIEAYQTGINIWDEEWESGTFNTTTGANAVSSSQIRAKNYIKLLPNTTYYVTYNAVGAMWGMFFDIDKKVIADYSFTTTRSANVFGLSNRVFTTPSNCYYMRFYLTTAYGTTYNKNFMISYGSTATSYEPYRSETVDYEFGVLGKNKFNKDAEPLMTGAYVDYSSVVGEPIKTYSHQNYKIYKVPIAPNTTYTFGTIKANDPCWALTDADSNVTYVAHNNGGTSGTTVTFTAGQNDYYLWLSVGFQSTYKCDDILQLELGSSATAYEPYDPNKTVYGGWVDLVSGEIQQEWGQRILNGSEAWNTQSPNTTYNRKFLTSFASDGIQSLNIFVNWIRPISTGSDAGMLIDGNLCCRLGWADKQFYILNAVEYLDEIVDIASLKEYLSNHNLQVVYPLATPITYSLAPTQLQTFLGQNNVWSNADYVEVEYDLHETQSILARKQFIIANQPHIVKPAAAPLQNFVTDLAAPLKECKAYFEPIQDLHGYDRPWVGGSGKNLFNINAIEQNPSDTTAANTTQRIFTPGTYAVGASYSNYWHDTNVTSYTINDDIITITSFSGYGIGFAFSATPGTSYVASATITTLTAGTTASGNINIAYYDAEGNFINMGYNGAQLNRVASVAPEDAAVLVVIFRGPNKDTTVAFSNIQVEEGSTATTYEPYENVCPISGWTEFEVNQSGKNINNNWLKPEGLTASGYYNGYSSWAKDWAVPTSLIGTTLRYSAFIDNTGTTDTRDAYLHIWTKDTNGTYVRTNATSETHLNPGESGRLVASITPRDTEAFISCGLTMPAGCKASEPLLEIGSTATNYEPYNGTTIPITFPSEAGTIYGGYVDLVNGEVVQEQIAKTFTILDSNQTNEHTNTIQYRFSFNVPLCGQGNATKGITMCDVAPYSYTNTDSVHWYTTTNNANGYVYIWLPKEFSNTDIITIVATLYTPQTIATLIPTQLKSLRGKNNIWSNAGDISVSYWTH